MVLGKLVLLAGGVGFLAVFSIGAWYLTRKVSFDVARDKGIKKVSSYLSQPILAMDYAEASNMSVPEVEEMVNKGELKGYSWGGHLFVGRTNENT